MAGTDFPRVGVALVADCPCPLPWQTSLIDQGTRLAEPGHGMTRIKVMITLLIDPTQPVGWALTALLQVKPFVLTGRSGWVHFICPCLCGVSENLAGHVRLPLQKLLDQLISLMEERLPQSGTQLFPSFPSPVLLPGPGVDAIALDHLLGNAGHSAHALTPTWTRWVPQDLHHWTTPPGGRGWIGDIFWRTQCRRALYTESSTFQYREELQ